MRKIKQGKAALEDIGFLVNYILGKYKNASSGPVCCFYIGKSKEVLGEDDKSYIDLDDFRNYEQNQDEEVIGCSRGCLPLRDWGSYLEQLCKGCVEEAERIIKSEG